MFNQNAVSQFQQARNAFMSQGPDKVALGLVHIDNGLLICFADMYLAMDSIKEQLAAQQKQLDAIKQQLAGQRR